MAGASAKTVDMSNVKESTGINKKRIPAGDYAAVIKSVADAKAKDDVFQYLFIISPKKYPSAAYPYYCKLVENQLWKLRNILIAAGKNVPKSKTKVDPNVIVGKVIGISVEDAEWDDKEQSEITGVFPAADLDDDDDDEVVDDDDEAEGDDDDLDDVGAVDEAEEDEADEDEAEEDEAPALDRDALKAAIKAIDPDYKIFKSTTDEALAAALEELTAVAPEDDEDEDEEEEEEAPAPVKKPAAKKTSTTTKKKIADVSDDELEELDIDEL